MKVLSRVASPAGFGLVLLLFFLLPFVSVSCDVPGYGEVGANYTGSHLVSGADPSPTVPEELKNLGSDESSSQTLDEPAPDPGVQVLAIALAVLAAIGVLTVLIPQVKARLFGATAVAGATLVLAVVTMVVAQSNLESAMLDSARNTGASEVENGLPRLTDAVAEMIHTEVGFWLIVVVLGLIVLATAGAGLLNGPPRMVAAGGGQFAGPPFGAGGQGSGAGGQWAAGEPKLAGRPESAGGPGSAADGEQGYVPPAESSAGAGWSGSGETGGVPGSATPSDALPPNDPPPSGPPQSGPPQSGPPAGSQQ